MNFSDILNKRADDIEAPKNMPIGTYLWAIPNPPKTSTIGDGKYEAIDFDLVCLLALDDVDQGALQEYGPVQGKHQRHRFMFDLAGTPEAEQSNTNRLFYFKQFLTESLGIDGDGKTIGQMLAEVPGKQVKANIGWRPDNRPGQQSRVFDEIKSTARAD
jgi:hypothetical protein